MTDVLTCADLGWAPLEALLGRYGLALAPVAEGAPIPGTFWGEPEAGMIGTALYARPDTPVHSLLHETAHVVCMDADRRAGLHTDAGGTALEECGVCYLEIRLAAELPDVGSERIMADMDAWGYSFRLGSTAAWYADDAEDAARWLNDHGLIDATGAPTWRLRT
ncbi:MAG: hypothetical protein ACLFTX_09875 [Thiohalospira sp.]